MFRVNNKDTSGDKRHFVLKTLRSGVFIVNFEHISHLVLMFLLLTLGR